MWDKYQEELREKGGVSLLPSAPRPEKCSFAGDIVFLDGYVVKLPESCIALSFLRAWEMYPILLAQQMKKTLANGAERKEILRTIREQGEGAFLYIQEEGKYSFREERTSPLQVSTYLQIHVAPNVRVSFVHDVQDPLHFQGVCDIFLGEGAHVEWQETCISTEKTVAFQGFRVYLREKAYFAAHIRANGGKAVEHLFRVFLLGEGAQAILKGLGKIEGEEEYLLDTCIEHIAPHAMSRQEFHSCITDAGKAQFRGKIYVHAEADKTESYQLHKTLLLSDRATSQSEPNLEIFASDVKASHGATVGTLSEESLLYLVSRGIEKEEAEALLVHAFCEEVFSRA